DIKPSNIIRRDLDAQVVLIDFGAVKQIQPQQQVDQENPETDQPAPTIAVGTSGYAPPEQYAGRPVFASDIYALGMIGIQALTGIHPQKLPFSTNTNEANWRHLANVSEEFAQILEKMVLYKSTERYSSAEVVMEKLKSLRL
ncbi:MAG: hypothetical protein LDL41_05825, partial [Coleofasciculus sp. S288]|nr:hypothetical protein [Coleofasciculus sp. S288]